MGCAIKKFKEKSWTWREVIIMLCQRNRIAMIPMFETKRLSKSLLKRLLKRQSKILSKGLSKTIYRPKVIV